MRGPLDGKVALITGGAGGGIGRAVTRRLHQDGAVVVMIDIRGDRVREIEGALREELGPDVHGFAADIANRGQIDDVLTRVHEHIGEPAIVVNNAALNVLAPVSEYRSEDWDRVMDVDLNAVFYLCRRTLPAMMERGWGSIVNVTSVAGYLHGYGVEGPYAAAKAAVHSLTRAIAYEGGPRGVRCNGVAPGIIDTWFIQNDPGSFDKEKEATPLRRFGTPEEVANVVSFLVSEQSSFVTGEVINVSGGWYMRA